MGISLTAPGEIPERPEVASDAYARNYSDRQKDRAKYEKVYLAKTDTLCKFCSELALNINLAKGEPVTCIEMPESRCCVIEVRGRRFRITASMFNKQPNSMDWQLSIMKKAIEYLWRKDALWTSAVRREEDQSQN